MLYGQPPGGAACFAKAAAARRHGVEVREREKRGKKKRHDGRGDVWNDSKYPFLAFDMEHNAGSTGQSEPPVIKILALNS